MTKEEIEIIENILRLISKVRHSTCMSDHYSDSFSRIFEQTEYLIKNIKKS